MFSRALVAFLNRQPQLRQLHHAPDTKSLLLRDYIQRSLYDPIQGYFLRPDIPVGFLESPINFRKVVNETEYKLLLRNLYRELQVSWLTPVELFKPWYGRAVAKYLLEVHSHAVKGSNRLAVYEVGGGTGTLARTVLDYIKEHAPQLYATTQYTCIEISRTLAERQLQQVVEQGGHRQQFKVVNQNAWDAEAWGGVRQQHCFVLMTEVLDNLPHDRVERSSTDADSPWHQTHAVLQSTASGSSDCGQGEHQWVSELQPAVDTLVLRCLNSGYGVEGGEGTSSDISWMKRVLEYAAGGEGSSTAGSLIRFLPTTCLALLDILHSLRPHHTIIAADFNQLPDVCIPGACAPLVSSLVDGVHQDYDSVFVPWGSADIFFPTDFNGLCRLYSEAAALAGGSGSGSGGGTGLSSEAAASSPAKSLRVSSVSSKEFMYRFADYQQVTTLGGFNPLLEDFSNTSFFLASSLPGEAQVAKKRKKLRKDVWAESQRR